MGEALITRRGGGGAKNTIFPASNFDYMDKPSSGRYFTTQWTQFDPNFIVDGFDPTKDKFVCCGFIGKPSLSGFMITEYDKEIELQDENGITIFLKCALTDDGKLTMFHRTASGTCESYVWPMFLYIY